MTEHAAYTPVYREDAVLCLICKHPLAVRLARGRKSGKPFVMMVCTQDGRHFRAFINYQPYVAQVLERVGGKS